MSLDEMLFYGGIVIVAVTIVLLLVYTFVSLTSISHLKRQLREEYGEENEMMKK